MTAPKTAQPIYSRQRSAPPPPWLNKSAAAPPLQLVVSRPCVAGPGGACSVCDAPQGEPCRRRSLAP